MIQLCRVVKCRETNLTKMTSRLSTIPPRGLHSAAFSPLNSIPVDSCTVISVPLSVRPSVGPLVQSIFLSVHKTHHLLGHLLAMTRDAENAGPETTGPENEGQNLTGGKSLLKFTIYRIFDETLLCGLNHGSVEY